MASANPYGGGNANPGGRGGKRTVIRKPPPPPKKKCCAMVAALGAARQGRFRLAGRYARYGTYLVIGRL